MNRILRGTLVKVVQNDYYAYVKVKKTVSLLLKNVIFLMFDVLFSLALKYKGI